MPTITTKDSTEIFYRTELRRADRVQPWLAAIGR